MQKLRPRLAVKAAGPAKRRVFYGWYVVAAGFVANIAYAEQFSAPYGVFIQHIGASTGWSRTALAGVKTVGRLTEALLAPFIGPVIDRYGARWLMAAGGLVAGVALIVVAAVEELWQLYLLLGILAPLGGVCLGGFVVSVTIANWFIARRGRAIGLANMGMSFSATLLPLAASLLIELWGWRGAWIAMGVMTIVLAAPAAVIFRRRPEDLGLLPDGALNPAPTSAPHSTQRPRHSGETPIGDVVWTQREVLRSQAMWVLVLSWGFTQFAMAGTVLHMVPFFQDLGYPLVLAAAALSLRSGIALAGTLVWGFALERLPLRPAASLQFILTGLGVGMWLLPASEWSLLAGIIFFGMGASGSQVVAELIWASYYGRLSLGTARGIAYPIQTVFAAVGPLVVGLLYDVSGSYRSSFAIMVVGCLTSAALIQLARHPVHPRAPSSRAVKTPV